MLNIQEINNIKYKIKMLDIEEFSKKLIKKSRLMGIDPGKKRVGIAISDENRIFVFLLLTCRNETKSTSNEVL